MNNTKPFNQTLKEIGRDKNLSLMNYLQYRVLFNQGKRTVKGNIKVFFMDLKISAWAYLSGATISYEKMDQVNAEKMRKDLKNVGGNV